jgi:hypothetical protein
VYGESDFGIWRSGEHIATKSLCLGIWRLGKRTAVETEGCQVCSDKGMKVETLRRDFCAD